MAQLLRWQVSRLYEPEVLPEGGGLRAEVTVTPARRRRRGSVLRWSARRLASADSDRLEWWDDDETRQFTGRTTTGALIAALDSRNALPDRARVPVGPESRRIVEDMVFLQIVRDNAADALAAKLRSCGGIPDLGGLVALETARWLDFTRQARQMAANLYRQALGREEAGDAR